MARGNSFASKQLEGMVALAGLELGTVNLLVGLSIARWQARSPPRPPPRSLGFLRISTDLIKISYDFNMKIRLPKSSYDFL